MKIFVLLKMNFYGGGCMDHAQIGCFHYELVEFNDNFAKDMSKRFIILTASNIVIIV